MSNISINKIGFLLGSGVSIPSGMPSISDINNRIFTGKNVIRHTDGNYYFGSEPSANIGFTNEYVPRILEFINLLKLEIDNYYRYNSEHDTNYEELYYVASQIKDSESGEYDNPIVQPFIDKILPKMQHLLIARENEVRRSWNLHGIASETTNYISDIVWQMLSRNPCCNGRLCCIKDSCLDLQLSDVDIFTLNHDTLIEQYLSDNNIKINDGFGDPINNVRYWNSDFFESKASKVRLFKLHGSINWFRFRPDGGDWSQESIGIPIKQDIWHTRNEQGQLQMPVDGRPIFLAGTFNKMLQYTSGIYSDLHYQFYRSLQSIDRFVVCGYGFGDKGINTRIIQWTFSSGKNRMMIIHPSPDDLKRKARSAIRNNWDDWVNQKKLSIIKKGIEDSNWQEIKNLLKY